MFYYIVHCFCISISSQQAIVLSKKDTKLKYNKEESKIYANICRLRYSNYSRTVLVISSRILRRDITLLFSRTSAGCWEELGRVQYRRYCDQHIREFELQTGQGVEFTRSAG